MRALAEPQFHLLMTVLVVASLVLDQEASHWLPTWNMPKVGVVTFTLGLCWVALFAAHRIANLHRRLDVLQDLLDRTVRRTDALEDDARTRRGLPLR
jgi:hypothetical protein